MHPDLRYRQVPGRRRIVPGRVGADRNSCGPAPGPRVSRAGRGHAVRSTTTELLDGEFGIAISFEDQVAVRHSVFQFAVDPCLGLPGVSWPQNIQCSELKDGVLNGNLILKGYGDPKFTIEQFWLWLSELRARGLREIRGDLVLDRSYFDLPPHDPAQFDDDPARAYNVGPDALLINFNTLRLRPHAGRQQPENRYRTIARWHNF